MSTHIVNIEDDRPLRDILRVAFQVVEPNVKLHQFTSADEAFPYIDQYAQSIDLFVLDIRLPGSMDGLQIAQKLRERNYTGRIVVTSAFASPDQAFLTSLNIEYFPKPWRLMDLTHRVLQPRSGRSTPPMQLMAAS
jgi:DNA-binding response OmpR family regulator